MNSPALLEDIKADTSRLDFSKRATLSGARLWKWQLISNHKSNRQKNSIPRSPLSLCCLLLALTLSLTITSVKHHAKAEDVAGELKILDGETPEEMRKRLEEEKKMLEAIEDEKKGVNQKVEKLGKERARLTNLMRNYAKRIQESETTLSKLELKLADLQKKEKIVQRSLKERRSSISEMLGLLQRMGRNPPPIMATHRDDALKMVRSAMLMSNILPKLKTQADGLKAELNNLVELKKNIALQSEKLRVQNAEMEADRLRVKELREDKNERIISHNLELQQIEKRAKDHAKSVKNLGQLIARVDREIVRRTELGAYEQQLIEDEKLAAKKIGAKAAVELSPTEKKNIVFTNPGRITPALPFGKAKQTLSLPARGKKLRNFGEKMKYGDTSKGLTIETRPNAQVTSPADGWIVYAGKFRTYGQLLIINAGGGYHLLLAGLDRIDVRTGQFVLAGEPIGVMSEPRANEKNKKSKAEDAPLLYVEFRKDGQPIDPSPWWADDQIASSN